MKRKSKVTGGKKVAVPSALKDSKENKKSHSKPSHPLLKITVKFLLLTLIVGSAIYYVDRKGYFNSDSLNDHTVKKWDAFYDFTEENNVDILLLGNSHLYTGVNPKNLSAALGANAFILASPGTHIADSYFSLKEAIKRCKPGLVIVETYGINNFDPYHLRSGSLSEQFKSFNARKDFITKALSTPYLFSIDNYVYAWSNAIRNHDYIFTNIKQINDNIELSKTRKKQKTRELYLGRYVRFTTGIEDTTLSKYDTKGAPVDGNLYTYSKYAEEYVSKIVRLCNEESIEVMFLTLPMYHKHVKDYPTWKNTLAEILNDHPKKWLDMQDPYSHVDFTPICFENTLGINQHMTYQGSLVATYKLAGFIQANFNGKLQNRKNDQQWHRIFYGQEGYFENYAPHPSDQNNRLLCANKPIRNAILEEVIILNDKSRQSKTIMAKVNRKHFTHTNLKDSKLTLEMKFSVNGQEQTGVLELQYDKLHEVPGKALFVQHIKPIQVLSVEDGMVTTLSNTLAQN